MQNKEAVIIESGQSTASAHAKTPDFSLSSHTLPVQKADTRFDGIGAKRPNPKRPRVKMPECQNARGS